MRVNCECPFSLSIFHSSSFCPDAWMDGWMGVQQQSTNCHGLPFKFAEALADQDGWCITQREYSIMNYVSPEWKRTSEEESPPSWLAGWMRTMGTFKRDVQEIRNSKAQKTPDTQRLDDSRTSDHSFIHSPRSTEEDEPESFPFLLYYWKLWTWHINSIPIFAMQKCISRSRRVVALGDRAMTLSSSAASRCLPPWCRSIGGMVVAENFCKHVLNWREILQLLGLFSGAHSFAVIGLLLLLALLP